MTDLDQTRPLRVGDRLVGFCAGFFGRDSYGDKRIEALGPDWCVAREIDSSQIVVATSGDNADGIDQFLLPHRGAPIGDDDV